MARKNATEMLSPDDKGLSRAAAILTEDGLVAVPTETVYGLAARADSPDAVAQIYALKGRPDFNPLIVHVRDLEQAQQLAELNEPARKLAERFWPGPLTLVLPLREGAALAGAVTAGLPTVALRQPRHKIMRALLSKTGFPLAAPSANRSEEISPTRATHVMASFGEDSPAVIDGGPSTDGLESTIVALREEGDWSLLRPGPVTLEALECILGPPLDQSRGSVEAPGQLARHYSPGKPIRLDATDFRPSEYGIGFGAMHCDSTLSATRNLNEAAARLYDCLHHAAASPKPRIAVAPIPDEALGRAVNDRLRRAASD